MHKYLRAFCKLFLDKESFWTDIRASFLGFLTITLPIVGMSLLLPLWDELIYSLRHNTDNNIFLILLGYFFILLWIAAFLFCLYIVLHALALVGYYTKAAFTTGVKAESDRDSLQNKLDRENARILEQAQEYKSEVQDAIVYLEQLETTKQTEASKQAESGGS